MVCAISMQAQDVPLFTQKLTNTFLYNPSVAGNSFGSATLSYRKLWSSVGDAPTTSFGSIHTPFARYRFGSGINFYQDLTNFNRTLYTSAAFAYHIRLSEAQTLSFGTSAEFNNQKLDFSKADVLHEDDPRLKGSNSMQHFDFSFGASFKSKYFIIGGSANRLSSWIGKTDSTSLFPAFYTGSLQFIVPIQDDGTYFEPMLIYRASIGRNAQIDGGAYFTYRNIVTLGGSYRSGGSMNITAGFRINNRLLIGISRDWFTSDVNKAIGASYEATLRFDFKDHSYYLNGKNARVINNSALALRRKTINKVHSSGSPYAYNKKYKHQIRKKSYMSPNYRINASNKLMTVKRAKTKLARGG